MSDETGSPLNKLEEAVDRLVKHAANDTKRYRALDDCKAALAEVRSMPVDDEQRGDVSHKLRELKDKCTPVNAFLGCAIRDVAEDFAV